MEYVFAYHKGNTENYDEDCVIDIVPNGTNYSFDDTDDTTGIIVSYLREDDEDVYLLKRESITKAAFEDRFGPIPYPPVP